MACCKEEVCQHDLSRDMMFWETPCQGFRARDLNAQLTSIWKRAPTGRNAFLYQSCCTGNVKCEVVGFLRKMLNGGYYPWAPKSGAGYVDIDDVAAAHTLAMVTPKASGR
jgi:hypothetical protein